MSLEPSDDPIRGRRPPGLVRTLAFLGVLCVVEGWALRAADPDFPLLDPFHWLAILLSVLFAVASLVRTRWLRATLWAIVFALPIGILFAEWRSATRDLDVLHGRIAISDDMLLRYTYRPGATVEGAGDGDPSMTITADGLWDQPHALPKPPEVDRVVVLGDSVPNDPSIPFARRFPHRLEELLAEHAPPGRRVEVVNVSCEGYNTIQEERLLEKVGLRYEPRVVVLAYVLNDPFLQNGGYRRLGNSFFAFQFIPLVGMARGKNFCDMFADLNQGYAYELVVRNSLERLRLIADRSHFSVLVAPLPIVERFDDPTCLGLYDKVMGIAHDQGFSALRVADAFRGEDYHQYLKPKNRFDITHPNAAGHERIARQIESGVVSLLWPAP